MTVQAPGGQPRKLDVAAKITRPFRAASARDLNGMQRLRVEYREDEKRFRHQFFELRGETLVWKMPSFFRGKYEINEIFNRSRKFKTIILDLRGNPGGAEETLLAMVSNLFDRDIKLGDMIRRKEKKPLIAKTRGKSAFGGNLIVLVNADSASSAEMLARVVQIEKRGTVIGDQTPGMVMRARVYTEQIGAEAVMFYGVSIADADLIMTDGKSLEKVGVAPDELLLPTAADLASNRDPVLTRACALAGATVDSIEAGKLFPYQWPDER